jgi:hypothetical protein
MWFSSLSPIFQGSDGGGGYVQGIKSTGRRDGSGETEMGIWDNF